MGQGVQHGLVGHRVGVGTQFGEFVAERLRQNLRAHGQDLPDFDEGGAERLEHETHFDRRESVDCVELVGDPDDLVETLEFAAPGEMVFFGEIVLPAAEQAYFFAGVCGRGARGLLLGTIVRERRIVRRGVTSRGGF